jgi:hypothetical protein
MDDNPYSPPTIPRDEAQARAQQQRSHLVCLAASVAIGCVAGFFASGRAHFPEAATGIDIELRILISMISGGVLSMLAHLLWRKLRSSSLPGSKQNDTRSGER